MSMTRITTLILLAFATNLVAQEKRSFSLDEAVSQAISNNYQLQQKQIDVEIAKAQVKETTALGLPQISGEASMNYYLDIPTQLAEPFDLGADFGPIFQALNIDPPQQDPDALQAFQFGLPWSASAGVTASQLLFDGSYFVGLKAAKAYVQNSQLGLEKSEIDVKNSVTQTYFSIVAMDKTLEALEEDMANISKTAEETYQLYKNGFAERQDADQVKLMERNLQYQIDATERQRDQMADLLKFQMGVSVNEEIELTTSMEELTEIGENANGILENDVNVQNHIDYRMVQQGLELSELSLSNERAKYYPSLNAFFTHSQNGFARDFGELLDAPYKQYYPTTLAGVQLNVPIFSSGMRYYKNKQAKLEIQKVMSQKQQVEENIMREAATARENYRSAMERHLLQEEDLKLAADIKETMEVKFKEGMASSQELNNAQSQYLQTLRNYINTTLELLNAKLELDRALGNA